MNRRNWLAIEGNPFKSSTDLQRKVYNSSPDLKMKYKSAESLGVPFSRMFTGIRQPLKLIKDAIISTIKSTVSDPLLADILILELFNNEHARGNEESMLYLYNYINDTRFRGLIEVALENKISYGQFHSIASCIHVFSGTLTKETCMEMANNYKPPQELDTQP